MRRNVLLVQPDYYSQYPPLGLLKLSSYHKKLGDDTEFVKGIQNAEKEPNIIYVTSLFTWAWRPVWKAIAYYKRAFPEAEIWLGGLYATLLLEHAELSGIDKSHIFKGVFKKAENLLPDYSLVPKWNGKNWDASIVFSSRGCIRDCGYCAVPRLEGKICAAKKSIKKLIWKGHRRIIFFDNNFLASPYWRNILDEVEELALRVDFNQGLDSRLFTEEVAKRIARLKIHDVIRLSYDYSQEGTYVKKAIDLLNKNGIDRRKILVYTLFNYSESPEELLQRIRDIFRWGAACYPMRYQPVYALEKNKYIAPKWNYNRLELVERARRVIGYGGAFPPYNGLVDKFERARDFDEAFALREPVREKNDLCMLRQQN